jgi:hypothetical protein
VAQIYPSLLLRRACGKIEISQITVYFTGTFYIEIPLFYSVCTVSSCVGGWGGGGEHIENLQ